jgi:hypothetical protein
VAQPSSRQKREDDLLLHIRDLGLSADLEAGGITPRSAALG